MLEELWEKFIPNTILPMITTITYGLNHVIKPSIQFHICL